jgi:hypothetical protein
MVCVVALVGTADWQTTWSHADSIQSRNPGKMALKWVITKGRNSEYRCSPTFETVHFWLETNTICYTWEGRIYLSVGRKELSHLKVRVCVYERVYVSELKLMVCAGWHNAQPNSSTSFPITWGPWDARTVLMFLSSVYERARLYE